jgi:hypothetical protein
VGAAAFLALDRADSGVFWPAAIGAGAAVGALGEAAIWLRPPRPARQRLLFTAWALPALLTVAGLTILALFSGLEGAPSRVVGAALAAAWLALALLLQNAQAANGADAAGPTRLGLAALTYAVAFALFALVYGMATSVPVIALGSGVVGGCLAAVQLRVHGASSSVSRPHALAIGLVMLQAGAGLAFWSVSALVGGALLLLLFYVLTGLAEALLDGSLDRRVALEYAAVAVIGMALVLSTGSARG